MLLEAGSADRPLLINTSHTAGTLDYELLARTLFTVAEERLEERRRSASRTSSGGGSGTPVTPPVAVSGMSSVEPDLSGRSILVGKRGAGAGARATDESGSQGHFPTLLT